MLRHLTVSDYQNLENRINSLETNQFETWLNDPFESQSDVSTNTSNLSVDVLGVSVMSGNSTKARLVEHGNAINSIFNCLRTKGLMAT